MNEATTQTIARNSLYESDFLLWTQDTIAKLKARDFDHLDLENLLEEIEALGNSYRDELESRLETLIEHCLKRLCVDMPQEFNGWERTIREQRRRLKRRLQKTPSLKTVWDESLLEAFEFALETVRDDYPKYQFPDTWQFGRDIDTLLNTNFWE
ncbi:DUF29 domain-containing protein [Pseudanabaena sp. FACHB-1998]|uniref:DUF29 domain-containing protein n=1 Tax=Pseudanabaena sp. FACHB-1998 TaxID=2692858 RepID=UPI00167FFFB4|nr:DUF29 domain-containing protein [Pseudanabaena sp. FACHB-1998]MBD2179173.1 DUF29 domain-containing protein [Pseudanabaena sp. FACHB-1998]